MNAIDNANNRHDWWWMEAGFDYAPPAPQKFASTWNGQTQDGGATWPGTALEAAFHLAMLPFGQMYMAHVAPDGKATAPRRAPIAGPEVEFDVDYVRTDDDASATTI